MPKPKLVMVVLVLLTLIGCGVFYATHRVPAGAPILSRTVCLSGERLDAYMLLVGIFNWQREVRPKYGFVIFDKIGRITHWDETLAMERGQDYKVCRTDIHGNNASASRFVYIYAR